MTPFPTDFRDLPHKAQHEALRALAGAKADASPPGSPSQSRWDDLMWIEDSYIQAIERQEAKAQ